LLRNLTVKPALCDMTARSIMAEESLRDRQQQQQQQQLLQQLHRQQ
jgi:hypothetical protein